MEKEGVRNGLRILKPETVKWSAFDVFTAWRVFSLDRYARDEPESPAAEVPTEDERYGTGIVVRGERMLSLAERGRPFPPDIRSWVVLMAHCGLEPTIRCPLPGNEILWRACLQLQTMVHVTQAARAHQPCPNPHLCQM